MTRKELMVELVRSLAKRLNHEAPFSVAKFTDITESLDADKFKDAISSIFSERPVSSFSSLMKRIQSLNEDECSKVMDTPLHYKKGEADDPHTSLIKSLLYNKTNQCLVITTSYLYEKCKGPDIEDKFFIAFENIFLAVKDDEVQLNSFLSIIEQKQEFGYIVLADNDAFNPWNMYGYACLCHINEEKFEIPTNLKYLPNTPFHVNPIVYDTNVPYFQYFDVYNVLNESKHTQDILARYLRFYQVLEYFAFRVHLVAIANVAIRSSAFVRATIKEAFKSSTKEEETFISSFSKLFPNIIDAGKLDKAAITPYDTFLDTNYGIKSGEQHLPTKIAKIIYKIRNSIVHNKATELHFSYGNIDEYQDGIGLIKLIIVKMEAEIIDLINDPRRTELRFIDASMPLY